MDISLDSRTAQNAKVKNELLALNFFKFQLNKFSILILNIVKIDKKAEFDESNKQNFYHRLKPRR